jgi:8-oxo-dGTP pyrophosphatase MutT (NUDIX family)
MKTKSSFGISLVRFNEFHRRYEILIVKRRISYAFTDFVLGNYSLHNKIQIRNLFNKMTNDEKIEILKGDYENLYYRLYLQNPPVVNNKINNVMDIFNPTKTSEMRNYLFRKHHYEKLYYENNGLYMKMLITNSASNNAVIYEIPKGRLHKNERPLDGAIREFTEETNFKRSLYTILDKPPIQTSYVSDNVKYYIRLYLAYTNCQEEIKLRFNPQQISEISEIRWCGFNEISMLNNHHLTNLSRQIFSVLSDG